MTESHYTYGKLAMAVAYRTSEPDGSFARRNMSKNSKWLGPRGRLGLRSRPLRLTTSPNARHV